MPERSAKLFRDAQQVLTGGVSRNTLLRKPHPIYVSHGSGCRVVDVDGVERIDFANNMASLIHGHAHPAITEAVTEQLGRGTAFTMATEAEIEYARHLCGRSPSFDKVRFMNSGTEAIMAALKAARAFTGRPKIAKVEGAYHGAYDYAEVSQAPTPGTWGERSNPVSVPLAVGTPEPILNDVIILPFNDPEAATAVLDQHRGEIACIILDPMPHRVGLVPADAAFVQTMHKWAGDNGALLVFDEVITFRTEVGGMQARHDVAPDLTAMGKFVGGGFPVGILAGRDEVMEVFVRGDSGLRLPHSGTFSANPVTMTAGLVAMELFDAEAVLRLNRMADQARRKIEEAIAVAGVPASVTGTGSLFRIHMKAEAPQDYRSAFPTVEEAECLTRFVDALYDNGIMMVHTAMGVLSTVMGDAEIDRLAEAVLSSLRQIKD